MVQNSNLLSRELSLASLFVIFLISFSFLNADGAIFVLENQNINYQIEGGTVMDMQLDPDFIELIVEIDSTNDGLLEISIPRAVLDAKFEDMDDIFFVIVDGFDTEYLEIENGPDSRTLVIPFFNGDSQIEIIGTDVLQESFEEIISETEIKIPAWVKNNAEWWADDLIGDSEFVSGIQYLITEGIMTIPPTQSGSSSAEKIPVWIKNNAEWWADDLIGDSEFVSGIQFLITEGIMKV